MINKKDYTLILIQTVERLFSDIKTFVEENDDILILVKDDPFELLIEDSSNDSNFQFNVSNPNQDIKNKILFSVNFNPQNEITKKSIEATIEATQVISQLKHWANLIRLYNKVHLSPDDNILKEYEKEFYDNFELLDDDADINPYDLKKQIIIHNYFEEVIKILKTKEEENGDLIQLAEEIKENIPKMTKKSTVKAISFFFAKVRKKGLKLLKELLEVGKKEIFKKAIKAGFELIGELTEIIT